MIHCIASRRQPVDSSRRSLSLGGGISATSRPLRSVSRLFAARARDAAMAFPTSGGGCATLGSGPTLAAGLAMACAR